MSWVIVVAPHVTTLVQLAQLPKGSRVGVLYSTKDNNLAIDVGAESGVTYNEPSAAALEAAGAWEFVNALPAGLDTVVGSGGHALTEAQSQQLALARLERLGRRVGELQRTWTLRGVVRANLGPHSELLTKYGSDAEITQLLEGCDDVFDAVEQLAFGEFQLKVVRRQPGFLQHLAHQTDQFALTQLMHRQVHRNPDRCQPLTLPFARLPAGLTQDEFADRPDQPCFFGQRNERARPGQPRQPHHRSRRAVGAGSRRAPRPSCGPA